MTKDELHERFVKDAEDEFNEIVLQAIEFSKSNELLKSLKVAGLPILEWVASPCIMTNWKDIRNDYVKKCVKRKIDQRISEAQLFNEFYLTLKAMVEKYYGK